MASAGSAKGSRKIDPGRSTLQPKQKTYTKAQALARALGLSDGERATVGPPATHPRASLQGRPSVIVTTADGRQINLGPSILSTKLVTASAPQESAEKVEFTTVFIKHITEGRFGAPLKEAVDWVKSRKMLGYLKNFKRNEIDSTQQYEGMRTVLAGLDAEGWMKFWDEIVESGLNVQEKLTGANAKERLMMRWTKIADEITWLQDVPGTDPVTFSSVGLRHRFKSCVGLLLTVIKDLQDNPSGFFAGKLGGHAVQPWPQATLSTASAVEDDAESDGLGDEVEEVRTGKKRAARRCDRGGQDQKSMKRARKFRLGSPPPENTGLESAATAAGDTDETSLFMDPALFEEESGYGDIAGDADTTAAGDMIEMSTAAAPALGTTSGTDAALSYTAAADNAAEMAVAVSGETPSVADLRAELSRVKGEKADLAEKSAKQARVTVGLQLENAALKAEKAKLESWIDHVETKCQVNVAAMMGEK